MLKHSSLIVLIHISSGYGRSYLIWERLYSYDITRRDSAWNICFIGRKPTESNIASSPLIWKLKTNIITFGKRVFRPVKSSSNFSVSFICLESWCARLTRDCCSLIPSFRREDWPAWLTLSMLCSPASFPCLSSFSLSKQWLLLKSY